MCGIFGIVLAEDTRMTARAMAITAEGLFTLSETRGKESAGLAVRNGGPIRVFKQPVAASVMIRSRAYRDLLQTVFCKGAGAANPGALIGHSRLVTNGFQENNQNNQPVVAEGMVAIHNGIITNDEELWHRFSGLERSYQVDTEVLLRLIRMYVREGRSLTDSVRASFAEIQGYASVAILFNDLNHLLLATNNGSLYSVVSPSANALIFASERFILETLIGRRGLQRAFGEAHVTRIEPGTACWIDLQDLGADQFALFDDDRIETGPTEEANPQEIVDISSRYQREFECRRVRAYAPQIVIGGDDPSLLEQHLPWVARLKRCRQCVLPESYPYIAFDDLGVCNYCRNPKPVVSKGADALAEAMAPFRRRDGTPEVIVAVSGGRDSIYGLHYFKKVLGMNALAYTYDWGMVTDLARRNISRICGKLGVEHLLISADITRKRANIRRNILAWLKRPRLGIIPLFMAGDKHFFYYGTKLQRQTGVKLLIWCSGSGLEDADFKWFFSGIDIDSGSLAHKRKLMQYYAREFLLNPAYVNRTLFDTAFGYFSYYFWPREFLYLYEYLAWNEQELLQVLADEYGWERSSDTRQTWRIGDGTASFYNYIYHAVAGFSENDTFRSEQVRRGMITREQAIRFVETENIPRYESIKWYLSIVGLGEQFERVVRTISEMPKYYDTDKPGIERLQRRPYWK